MRGVDKLTEEMRGKALLRDRVEMLLNTELVNLVVVLPSDHPARVAALEGLDVDIALNPEAKTGMASSIQAGINCVTKGVQAALIMPADMPDVTSKDIDALLTGFSEAPDRIHRAATSDGVPGSPVIFPAAFFSELRGLEGDESGRTVLKAHPDQLRLHPLPGTHAVCDLDTPEAWAAWRARSPSE